MAGQSERKVLSKQVLNIVDHEIDVPYSQGAKFLDRVKAVNLSLPDDSPLAGKELRMTIFNGDLKTFVRGKEKVTADVEETTRPDKPEYGPDRTIVQCYDDKGEPVSRKRGGGGGPRRSLEDDLALEAVKRRSIEGQTAVARVGAFLAADREISGESLGISKEDWDRIVGKYWKAVEKGLDNYLATPAPKADQRAQDKKSGPPKAPPDKKDTPPYDEPVKNVGDLLTRASKLHPPITRADVVEMFAVNDPKEIQDLEDAWKKIKEASASRRKSSGQKAADEKAASETTEEAWKNLDREKA